MAQLSSTNIFGNLSVTGNIVSSSGGATFNQTPANIFIIQATGAPTTDMVQITNANQNATTTGVNALQINYLAGSTTAANENSAIRTEITPVASIYTGSVVNAIRIIASTAIPTSGAIGNGIKWDAKSTGNGTSNAMWVGTGWDNILYYDTKVIISGTGSLDNILATGGTTTADLWSEITTGSIAIGAGLTTGTLNLDASSTKAHTVNLGTGATEASTTKTINIGTAGVASSVTNINIGSSVASSTGTTTISSLTAVKVSRLTTNGPVYTSGGDGTLNSEAQLAVSRGGTGIGSYAIGDILYASGATTLSKLADVATGNALISGGVTTAPSWGKIGLTTHISGTLAVGNGGTGGTTFTANAILTGNTTSAFQVPGPTLTSTTMTFGGAGTINSTTTSALTLDSTSTGAINIGNNANAKTITIGNATGATGVVVNSGTAGVTFNQVAAGIFKIAASAAPTTDMVQITNTGKINVTADINAMQVDYFAALTSTAEASATRINITNTSITNTTKTNALRIYATGSATANVVTNGLKLDIAAADTGISNAIYVGSTSWDNILNCNGNILIGGTGKVYAATGGIAVAGGNSDKIFYENGQTVTADYTITSGTNAGTFGPVTINSGVTVTIPNGCVWTIV